MPVVKNREYRAVVVPFNAVNDNKRLNSDYYVEGYATTFNKPYLLYEFDGVKYYEVIEKNALDKADMSDIIMQYDHQGKVLARKSNGTLVVEPNDQGIFIAADLSKSRASKDLHEEIESGLVTKMSWAFAVEEESYNSETRTRTIKKVKKVYDVSAVSIPASEDTEISVRSFVNGVIDKEKQELLERKRKILKLKLELEV